MSQQFLIELDDKIAHHVNEIATLTGQSVDRVLADKVSAQSVMPSPDIDANLAQLTTLSDVQLWWLIALGFPSDSKARLDELTAKSKVAELSGTELQEQEHLLQSYDWYQLMRAEGFVVLQERGYDVQSYLNRHKPSL
jgi:uncharacterized protein YnzC (UPF0291/DUF896 family)